MTRSPLLLLLALLLPVGAPAAESDADALLADIATLIRTGDALDPRPSRAETDALIAEIGELLAAQDSLARAGEATPATPPAAPAPPPAPGYHLRFLLSDADGGNGEVGIGISGGPFAVRGDTAAGDIAVAGELHADVAGVHLRYRVEGVAEASGSIVLQPRQVTELVQVDGRRLRVLARPLTPPSPVLRTR